MSTTTPDQQLSLTEAIEAVQDATTATAGTDTLQDDRVVDDALTCACGRPAGADGLCYGCRMDTVNDGRRL